jgi:hypothetical protein
VKLFIFSYSAVYLNLPKPNCTRLKRGSHQIVFTLLGALAPEFLLLLAFRQMQDARKLSKRLRALWKEAEAVGCLGTPDVGPNIICKAMTDNFRLMRAGSI